MGTSPFAGWVTSFEAAAEQRRADGGPDWTRGAKLDAAIVRSLQRFQLGESGDGANLAADLIGGRMSAGHFDFRLAGRGDLTRFIVVQDEDMMDAVSARPGIVPGWCWRLP